MQNIIRFLKLLSKIDRKNRSVTDIKELQRGITITVIIPWPFFFCSSNISWISSFLQNIFRFLIVLIKICREKKDKSAHFLSIYNVVTLKIRSRSPKSNHFFPPSWWGIYASLVKFQPLVKEIECTHTVYCINKAHCLSIYNVVTLEIRSMSPKSNHFFVPSWWCICACLVKFHHWLKR